MNQEILNNQDISIIPQKNIYKPLFFIFFSLFLIMVAIFITLFLTKNKNIVSGEVIINTPVNTVNPTIVDEFKNWKTYENKEIGFSVKYPEDYSIREYNNKTDPTVAILFRTKDENIGASISKITVKIENKLGLDIEPWYYKVYNEKNVSISHITINSIDCLKIDNQAGEAPMNTLHIPYKDFVISITDEDGSMIFDDKFLSKIYSSLNFN